MHPQYREKRRIGHRNEDVVLTRYSNQKPPGRYVEGKIVDTSAEQARPPQFGTDETINLYATVRFFSRQACNGVVVKLAAGDDMDVVPGVRQVERELR